MSSKQLILITGANQGLGYYAAQQLAETGNYHVIIGGRDIKKVNAAIDSIAADQSVEVNKNDLEGLQLDVTSDDSIKAAAAQVEKTHGKLDILLNNAGISNVQNVSAREQLQCLYDTNVFGPIMVTEAFLPLLQKGTAKRLAFTSSGLGSLTWAHDSDGLYSGEHWSEYRSTKAALNMVLLKYAKTLGKEGFIVSAADPGYCATNLNANNGPKDPRDGAKVLIRSFTGSKDEVHGAVIDETSKLPW